MSVDPLANLPPTAPGGGEFGAPVTSRTDTIDESQIGGPSRLKLKIQPSPPQYPYADTFFRLEVRESVHTQVCTEIRFKQVMYVMYASTQEMGRKINDYLLAALKYFYWHYYIYIIFTIYGVYEYLYRVQQYIVCRMYGHGVNVNGMCMMIV